MRREGDEVFAKTRASCSISQHAHVHTYTHIHTHTHIQTYTNTYTYTHTFDGACENVNLSQLLWGEEWVWCDEREVECDWLLKVDAGFECEVKSALNALLAKEQRQDVDGDVAEARDGLVLFLLFLKVLHNGDVDS